jgi:hypothetical protein
MILSGAVGVAQQPSGAGSLALTGQVDGSVGLLFWQDSNGYQFTDGSSSSTIDLGDLSAYGTPNGLLGSKFTKGSDADGFHVSTPFLVQVLKANLSSPTYTLTAQLGDNDDTVWEIDGVFLSTTPALLSNAEPYAIKRQHILYAKFPFSKAPGALSDAITFTVTAN